MKEILAFIRTTIVGGVLFLLPVVVIVFVLGKAADLVGGIAEPLVVRLGIDSVAGIAASTLMSILLIALCAFVAGLFALTRPGQAAMAWLQNGGMATLPAAKGSEYERRSKRARSRGCDANTDGSGGTLPPRWVSDGKGGKGLKRWAKGRT